MNRDASQLPSSVETARRLVARETSGSKGSPAKVGAALQRACARVSDNLRDSLGDAGRNALLVRAFAQTEANHPALSKMVGMDENGIHLNGVRASAEANGAAAVTAAVEAMLAALVEILGRLIGEDMAIRVIDPNAPESRRSRGQRAT